MVKSYAKAPCKWCGRRISTNGLATTSHWKACKVRLADRAERDRMDRLLAGARPMTHDETDERAVVDLTKKETP